MEIKRSIMNEGSVHTIMIALRDFLTYESGIYTRNSDTLVGIHAVQLIGWGKEKGESYWIGVNSWGETWGLNVSNALLTFSLINFNNVGIFQPKQQQYRVQPSSPTKILPATIINETISSSPKKTNSSRRSSLVIDYESPELSSLVFGFVVGTPPKRSDSLSNNSDTTSVMSFGSPQSAPPVFSPSKKRSQSLYKEQRMVNSCKELKKNRIIPVNAEVALPKSSSMHALRTDKNDGISRGRSSTLGSVPKSSISRSSSFSNNGGSSAVVANPYSIVGPSSPSSPSSPLLLSLFSSSSSNMMASSNLPPLCIGINRNTVPLIHVSTPEEPHAYEHLSPTIQEVLLSKLDKTSKDKALKKISRESAFVK
ncbi:predicted protein [Naegleria gruberi]|uniref:Predicted protein n=1 Tax=Naegleria gruberi TaxID=5762 RepID=D2W595_NAEGR|nr:uncharacterized protein NAEGRDRAFT_54763 [Naegleria gruberi]EFC35758.1 predicted protein [Naegleria gruberi]|eukprot:XP_002668502.1 predicted protein [Naegleria gruberi strain NEG-M]